MYCTIYHVICNNILLFLLLKNIISIHINAKEYYCEVCNYKVDRKSSYEKHIVSAKHHIKVAGMVKETQVKKR